MPTIDMNAATAAAGAAGLLPEDSDAVRELMRVWAEKKPRNDLRDRYYLGHVRAKTLGISMSKTFSERISARVDWPRKAVLALADRSVLNGFTSDDAATTDEVNRIYAANQLGTLYRKCLLGELRHCCGFWTVTADDEGAPVISAYPATAASALWDDSLKSIRAGLVVKESVAAPGGRKRIPSWVQVFTAGSVIDIRRVDGTWSAEYSESGMGRPLMEPMAYDATLERPFGRSRITRSVMSLTDDAMRQRARMELAAEFSAFPMTFILGTAKEVLSGSDGNYSAAIGALNELTKDRDGDVPSIWQSAQLQMQPLADYYRQLACQMASETDVPVSFFGVSSDNPSSADAIAASLEPLVIDAKNLNADNGNALRNVAYMALAVSRGTDFATERDAGANLNPRFMAPAYPSAVSQSDAVLKQVQALPKLADSDVMLELLGYTNEQMQSINNDHKRAQAENAVMSLLAPKKGADGAEEDTAKPAR